MLGIRYSCSLCGIEKAEVKVRFRESSEDVVAWMEQIVTPALVTDHAVRSPHCRPDSLSNVMIPVPSGTEWLGGPVRQ